MSVFVHSAWWISSEDNYRTPPRHDPYFEEFWEAVRLARLPDAYAPASAPFCELFAMGLANYTDPALPVLRKYRARRLKLWELECAAQRLVDWRVSEVCRRLEHGGRPKHYYTNPYTLGSSGIPKQTIVDGEALNWEQRSWQFWEDNYYLLQRAGLTECPLPSKQQLMLVLSHGC